MKTAQQMLDLYIQAESAVLLGQSVRFGERQLTRADLAEIRNGRKEWQAAVDRAANGRRRARWANADFGGVT
ncbi:MAG: primosomal replication protein PriB/PriC domain protein [Pseudomonas sp.]|uniref:primosomal replication protein PriB/PriC domain protein n=1 Tax=Stenotrophomonas sp. TaxID=69392 RepID=UPI003D6D7EA1